MPKPFMGVSANGCHHNISLWRGDENVFMPETDDQQKPSQIGLCAIGGILEHLGALTAITASTVNSYRRLWDTGFWAPVFADWGFQNRTTALRVSAPGRFEYRSVDSAVNPYLSMAALITAMWDGIERKLDPGEPEERNIYEAMEAGKEVKKIPMTFGDALDALEADEVVKKALPGEMYRVFMHYKRDEWERYCATVTDWDVDGVPRRPAVAQQRRRTTACAESPGSSTRTVEHPIGDEMTRMLQSMKHRGPDSTGYALYGQPSNGSWSCATSSPTRTRRATSSSRTGCAGTAPRSSAARTRSARTIHEVEEETEYAFRVTFDYDGDLKRLADFVEDIPDAEVLSLGHSLEIVKDLGDAEIGAEQYGLERLQRHARDRARPHGDRVRRRHLGRAPVLGVPVLRRRGRAQRPADELLPVEAAPRALGPPVPVRVRLGDHRRLPRREDERGRDARGGDATEPRRARRRLHVHRA